MPAREASLEFKGNCGLCGAPLTYGTEEVTMGCDFCRQEFSTLIYCPQGHYVCDSCHQAEAIEVIRQAAGSSSSSDPLDIIERVMSHPSVPMHGPEHHALVPAAIVAAVRNAGYAIPADAVEVAITRGARVPGGWCGSHGVCGAAVGVGAAVSVLTQATPLTGKQRTLANEATAFALSRMLDGHPRCCKRASRNAVGAAIDFLSERLGIELKRDAPIRCKHSWRNKECAKEQCPYYEPG